MAESFPSEVALSRPRIARSGDGDGFARGGVFALGSTFAGDAFLSSFALGSTFGEGAFLSAFALGSTFAGAGGGAGACSSNVTGRSKSYLLACPGKRVRLTRLGG